MSGNVETFVILGFFSTCCALVVRGFVLKFRFSTGLGGIRSAACGVTMVTIFFLEVGEC